MTTAVKRILIMIKKKVDEKSKNERGWCASGKGGTGPEGCDGMRR